MSNDPQKVKERRIRAYARAVHSDNALLKKHNSYKKQNDGFLYHGAADELQKSQDRIVKTEENAFKAGATSIDLYHAIY